MNSNVQKEVKNLIHHILQNEDNMDKINAKEKQIIFQLKKDTMSFVNRKEMDLLVQKMAEKFQFHGFFPQADHLQKVYNKYMNKTPKQDHTTAMNIVRFLLYMSDSPTDKFLEHPELFVIENEEEEEEAINWGEYLLEGIEVYEPEYFDDSSDDSDGFQSMNQSEEKLFENDKIIAPVESTSDIALKMDFNLNHEELMSTIQHTWYNKEYFSEIPPSKREEANIGVLWEEFLNSQTHGLLDLETTSFISEYKVAREVIWQMFGTHNSFLFYFKGNKLKIRDNVSISSVRNVSLAAFVEQFLEYIELIEFFRDFLDSFKYFEPSQTYISYGMAIRRNILEPIYEKLIEIEETIRKQEETFTLLRLGHSLIPIFAPLKALREIHQEITIPTQENSALHCSTSLICNLRSSLKYSITKLEHDLKLTLYIQSLYKYFFLIDSWLTRNDFVDLDGEFVLIQVTSTQSLEYKTSPLLSTKISYEVSENIKDEFGNNGIIQIICTKVLQIAKNIRLLFLLRKFDFYTKYEGTLHQELVKRFIEELCKYFKYENDDVLYNLDFQETDEPKALVIKHPVISSEKCKKPIDMDKLENFVDTNDSFLMEAFAEFIFEQKTFNEAKPCDMTLFERISKITTGLFPLRNCLERIFREILKERFSVSGLMVKGALIEDHHLDQIFEFLRALYLFCDASIFPFFQQFFEEMKFFHHSPWRYMKLSSHLKDVISDMFPSVCDKCDITLNSTKEQCIDALDICDSLNINVVMKWPLNIVITEEEIKVYKSLFHFMIKLKWSFHVLNSLSCKDLSTNTKSAGKLTKNTVKKLEVFKFSLLQCLNFIQHYVICFCFMKCLKQFELDFEKSNDLDSVIKAHCDFVEGIEYMVALLQSEDDEYNFKLVLYCVKVLNSAWYNMDLAMDVKVLDATYNLFKRCKAKIETQVNKIYLINY